MKNRMNQKLKIDETWIVVGLCFVMVCIVLGFCSSSKGLYISPVTEALGISRSVFSINDSVRFITTAVVNLFFGALIGKFGPKKLICAGFVCLIICMALGIFVSVNTAGYAVGAPISNLCYDLTGSYHIALYAGAALMLVVLIGMQFVISAANREHKKVEQSIEA